MKNTMNTTKKPQLKTRRQPLRRCVGCGEMKDKAALVRVALDKSGAINIDPTSKMHGRAAYLCLDIACYEKAKKSKGLERSFKRSVPPDIYSQLAQHLSVSVSQ